MMIIAHRGVSEFYPENSIPAIQAALDNPNIQGVEIDVQAVKDVYGKYQLIVFHDRTLGRMTQYKNIPVNTLSFEEIRALQLDNSTEYIPTLSEVLEQMQGSHKYLIIDIKSRNTEKLVAYELQKAFEQYDIDPRQCIVSSFFIPQLLTIHTLIPSVGIAPLRGLFHLPLIFRKIIQWIRLIIRPLKNQPSRITYRVIQSIEDIILSPLTPLYIHLHINSITSKIILDAKQTNMKVIAWGIEREKDYRKAEQLGTFGVIVDEIYESMK